MIFLYYLLRDLYLISYLFYDSSLTPWFITHSWHIHDTFSTISWYFHDTFKAREGQREPERAIIQVWTHTDRQTDTQTHTNTNTHAETTKWHTGLLVGANVTNERVMVWYGKHKNCWRRPLCCSIINYERLHLPHPWALGLSRSRLVMWHQTLINKQY